MRIAYVVPHFEKYGGIRRILNLTDELHKNKRNEIYLIPENGALDCDWFDIKIGVGNLAFLYNQSWDAVIFSLESQYKILQKVKAKAKIHYILHYGVIYKENCLESYKQPYYKKTNSTWTSKQLRKHLGYEPDVVYGGMNKEIFHPVKTRKVYDVMTYGDLRREWKGRGDVELIEQMMPDWKVGYMADINPSRKNIAKAYCSSKIFFSASWYEGWNWMGIEAMACGVPLIITKDGGSSDYAKDGYNCLQVDPRDPEQAIRDIGALLNDLTVRRKLIENGLKTAAKYTWKQSAKDFMLQVKKAIQYGRLAK